MLGLLIPGATMRLVVVAGIVGALAVLLLELATRRREAEQARQSAAHDERNHRRPVRPLRLAPWPAFAVEAPAAPVSRTRWPRAIRAVSLALVTPLLEKNVLKTLSLDVPVIFSMSRVVVLAFAVGMLRQIWSAGIAGWPEATLAIAIVLALPVLGALERIAPEQVVELTRTLVGRFGTGDVRTTGSAYSAGSREPSKHDDHRRD
jgi:hypothetical protein